MEKERNLFSEIAENSKNCIISCFGGYEKNYKKNEIISSYPNDDQNMGILCSGSAEIIRNDIKGNQDILEHLYENSVFGACLTYSAGTLNDSIAIVSETECRVLYLSFYKILHPCRNICDHHIRLIENLVYLMSEKTQKLSERIELLSKRTIRDKLDYYFMLQRRNTESDTFELPFSSTDMAAFLCVDRSAMMREIKKMKDENIIMYSKGKVKMLK